MLQIRERSVGGYEKTDEANNRYFTSTSINELPPCVLGDVMMKGKKKEFKKKLDRFSGR